MAVYAYFRHASTDACAIQDNLNRFDKDRVGTLGQLNNVSLQKDNETLDIDISLPSQMIADELKLPVACAQPSSKAGGRVVSGTQTRAATSPGLYSVSTSVGGAASRILNTPSGFKVYRKRGIAP